MKNKIILVTGSNSTKECLYKQLKEFIPDSYIIESFASEDGLNADLECDLLIISSLTMKQELDEKNIKYDSNKIVVCERSVNFDFIDLVADLPVNEEVLLVNDEKDTTEKSIKDLLDLGLNHINYYPYYPGISHYKKLKTAITPGEEDKVPACVNKVINLGSRIIDINSLYDIMDKLNLPHKDSTFITKKYMQKIINVSKRISAINNNINALNTYLNNIVNSLVNGIIVYDKDGYINFANDEMKKIFSIEKDLKHKNIKNIFDKEFISYFLNNDTYENKSFVIMGTEAKISKFFIPNSQNTVLTIKRNERSTIKNRYNHDLLLKGHFAKYNFDNIIGSSNSLNEVKNICTKLSKSELSVLIEGESGTGKELFASAIHNSSSRKYGPFIAVNFSALPDELIESELFGYEEGAFTGAKKGGKIGLFELADCGTIFLDEIGDVSLKVQTKLLRVLQEKEFLPLGGNAIKKVDVRIIGATNKNLKEMVVQKEFRADLYYRLKIGYIYLPPLRDRISDMEDLVHYFIKSETSSNISVSENVINEFKKYKWYGNVRELESTIKYMLAVRTDDLLTLSDLPDRKFFEEEMTETEEAAENEISENKKMRQSYDEVILNSEMIQILNTVNLLQNNNMSAGREKIKERLIESGLYLTESKIRNRLDNLEKYGLVIKRRGKHATVLTEKGFNILKNLKL